jgi:hypothetical protein
MQDGRAKPHSGGLNVKSKAEIFSGFGLYKKQKDEAREEARLLALNVLKEVEEKYKTLKGSEEYLHGVYYYLGAVMKYVLYLAGQEEGNYLSRGTALWKRNLVEELSYILDHPRTQGEYLISHPYSLRLSDLEKIVNVCKTRNLDLVVSGESEYFPGYTFKITISKKKQKPSSPP